MLNKTNNSIIILSFIFFFLLPIAAPSKLFLLSNAAEQYAVIFDAGSTGSRVHVFRFDQSLNLLKIGDDLEYYNSISPGLSDYANDPNGGALSLLPLLQEAENAVPQDLHPTTPIRLGATAGLRMLEGDTSERILESVRDLFQSESDFQYKADWVSILDGYHEGAYLWITVNYLLETLGGGYGETVATVDLGGGSVQMAYAISQQNAENAPEISESGDSYVESLYLGGTDYFVYAHSHLNYGLKAARAASLATSNNSSNPCVTTGYDGTYDYDGITYNAKAAPSGANIKECKKLAAKLLNLDAPCNYLNCSFNGAWNGGGGAGQKNLYVASFYYDTAVEVDIVDSSATSATVQPVDYLKAAKKACAATVDNINTVFPNIDSRDVPFLCMDLIYEYTLLVEGFGVKPFKKITTLKAIDYQNISVDVAWPLGCAIDVVSSIDKLNHRSKSFNNGVSSL